MKPFLAIDCGAASLKVALFEPQASGSLVLSHYEVVPLGQRGLEEADRVGLLKEVLQETLDRHEIRAKGLEAHICTPSYQSFTKFLRTPPVEGSKVGQIIQYEAQQNVPFPLDEVEWDYQILGTAETGELEVMLMALKLDVIDSLSTVCSDLGLKLAIVDGSAAALRNAFMHNYGEIEGCSLLIDIGSKTANVLFIEEGGKFFMRSVNFGANAVTQEFSRESGLDWAQAEEYKRAYGYVHVTNTAEPTDPYQAIVVKTARNVMTRLHQQVAQTIQYYRAQQGGSAPVRLFLAGGGASMLYTAEFFQEKLNLPVEFLNPFRNVELGPEVDPETLAREAHSLGEMAGLGLRATTMGMTEFNLLPRREKISRQVDKRGPYIIATIFCAGLILYVEGAKHSSVAKEKESQKKKIEESVSGFSTTVTRLAKAEGELDALGGKSKRMERILRSRFYWIELINAIQQTLDEADGKIFILSGQAKDTPGMMPKGDKTKDQINAPKIAEADTAVWLLSLTLNNSGATSGGQQAGFGQGGGGMMGQGGAGMMGQGGAGMAGQGGAGMAGQGGSSFGQESGAPGATGNSKAEEPVKVINLKLMAKNVLADSTDGKGEKVRTRETLNREYAQMVTDLFLRNALFSDNKEETKVMGNIEMRKVDGTDWFEFQIQLTLRDPIVMKDKELE